jgi:hypothetical protein
MKQRLQNAVGIFSEKNKSLYVEVDMAATLLTALWWTVMGF